MTSNFAMPSTISIQHNSDLFNALLEKVNHSLNTGLHTYLYIRLGTIIGTLEILKYIRTKAKIKIGSSLTAAFFSQK